MSHSLNPVLAVKRHWQTSTEPVSSDKQVLNAMTNLSLLSDKSEHVVTNLRLVRDKSKPLASQTHCVSLTSLSTSLHWVVSFK